MKHLHFLLFVFAFTAANAQIVSKTPPKQCSGLLARQLVEQQADDSKSVSETDRRVNILLRVADYLWLDKIKEDITREGTTNYFHFQRSKLAAEEKRFEDARKYALKVPKLEHRAVLFFDIAEAKMKEPMTKLESLDTLLEVY